jgi:hypothetical protein
MERYAEENARCLGAMMELRDQAVDDMSSAVELIRDAQFDMQRALEGRTRLHHNYLAYLNHLAVVHERLIRRYRELNRRMRRGEAPEYFRRTAVRPRFVEPPTLSPMLGLEADVRAEVIARIDHYIKAVNERLEQTMPEYQTVGQLGAMERASA